MGKVKEMIAERIRHIREWLPKGVTLLCVSKYHSAEAIREAYEAGERDFGESRLQELQQKAASLPGDIRWHFIGHLQTNKVRALLPLVTLIHGVDSLHLAQTISKEATTDVRILLEVHVAQEESKYGFTPEELLQLFQAGSLQSLPHLHLCGLMGMASLTDDETQIRQEFRTLRRLFDEIKEKYCKENQDWQTLSMGMTDDYPIAIEEGSTLIRLGSALFGERE